MKIQSWSWKAPALLASWLVIGWVLADAMDLPILHRHSQLPTIPDPLDTDDASALLQRSSVVPANHVDPVLEELKRSTGDVPIRFETP